MLRDIYIKIVMALKLIDLINESMADGGAFRAFVDNAVAKKEIQANEDIDDRITSVPGNGLGEGEENINNNDSIYILSSDGHRDSANFNWYAYDENSLKKGLISEASEVGYTVIEDTIKIDYGKEKIYYKYYQYGDNTYMEDGVWGFITVQKFK